MDIEIVDDDTRSSDTVVLSQNSTVPHQEAMPLFLPINNVMSSNEDNSLSSSQIGTGGEDDENSNSSSSVKVPSRKRPFEELDEDDGMTCPICLDTWTNCGEHRICALRCGHLFGYKCIVRWLKCETKKLCPTCKKKVSESDIRHIYARKIIALDTTELTLMKNQLQTAIEEKNKVQMELTKVACKEHSLLQTIDSQKKTIQTLTNQLQTMQQQGKINYKQNSSSNSLIKLYREKSIDLGKNSGSRVISANGGLDLVIASLKSPNSFYTGFGIRKYNVTTYKATAFIGLHSLTIRDMKFHADNPWVLTGAMDKYSTIVEMNSNEKILSTLCESPVWSCCWDPNNSKIFYVGTSNGSTIKYDMRNNSEPIEKLTVAGDMSPVVSVHAIRRQNFFPGVISCKLQSLWFFENANSVYTSQPLPIEGPFSSMTYSHSTGHMFITARPSAKYKQARYLLSTLSEKEGIKTCDTAHVFHGANNQKLLSRSCLISTTNDYAASYIEDSRTVDMWNINSGEKATCMPISDYVLDLAGLQVKDTNVLLALTESKLEFYKFTNS